MCTCSCKKRFMGEKFSDAKKTIRESKAFYKTAFSFASIELFKAEFCVSGLQLLLLVLSIEFRNLC